MTTATQAQTINNWHVRAVSPPPPEPNPNCMGRIIRYLRDDGNPLLLKIGTLFAASTALFAAVIYFQIKMTIAALVVLPVLIWARVEWSALNNLENAAQERAEARRQRLIDQQTAFTAMKEAFGGEAAFNQLSVLDIGNRMGSTGYIDFLQTGDLTAPIMRGQDRYGRPFISIKLRDRASRLESVITFFQRYDEGGRWSYGGELPTPGNLFDGALGSQDHTLIRQIVVERNHPTFELAT